MRDYDEYDTDAGPDDAGPYVVIQQRDTGLGLFLVGLALGAGAALLWAPQSGADTRRVIRDRARTVGDTARQRADELADSVASTIGDVRERFTEQVETARSAARHQRADIADAFDAGRSAAHEAKLEFERKLAEQKARHEAKVM